MVVNENICDKLSDEQLVSYSLADIDYFLCIYERYENRLLRYIQHITKVSPEQAEDILQDAFIKIWQNLRGFDPRLKLQSWIYRIVHNETISYWRKAHSNNSIKKVKFDEKILQERPIANSFFEDLEEKEKQLNDIMKLLPVSYRTVLLLKYIEGMSYQEISDVLKIPEGTVATRINRAKKRFSKLASDKHINFYSN